MAYVWAAITAPKLTSASQTLVRGGGTGRVSRDGSEEVNSPSSLDDVFERNERGYQEY